MQVANISRFSFLITNCSIIFLALLTSACLAQNSDVENTTINVVTDHNRKYYHMEFTLNADNLFMTNPVSDEVFHQDGGQFEVYIKKEKFPIKAPFCKKYIILRMPWTETTLQNAEKFIREKLNIYKKLLEVSESKRVDQKVTIELNPYMKINSTEPLDIELTQCNVFFRSSHGRYIDYHGNVKQ